VVALNPNSGVVVTASVRRPAARKRAMRSLSAGLGMDGTNRLPARDATPVGGDHEVLDRERYAGERRVGGPADERLRERLDDGVELAVGGDERRPRDVEDFGLGDLAGADGLREGGRVQLGVLVELHALQPPPSCRSAQYVRRPILRSGALQGKLLRMLRGMERAIGLVAARAAAPLAPAERAAEVLDGLRALVPYDCAALSAWDAAAGTYRPLAHVGYPDAVLSAVHGARFREELRAFGIIDGRGPVRIKDLPCDPASVATVAEVLWPAGLREGMTLVLYADGRHVGVLNLSTATAAHPTDEECRAVGLLAGALGAVAGVCAPVGAYGLTRRELQVLTLVAEARTNAEIAERLVVTRRTVTTHVEHILAKLGASSRTEAAVRAVREGLLVAL
jgi:DNA-binding CsgD family transcriptional regulator